MSIIDFQCAGTGKFCRYPTAPRAPWLLFTSGSGAVITAGMFTGATENAESSVTASCPFALA